MIFEPELMTFADGRQVTAENWADRRKEIIDILSHEEYGYTPAAPAKVTGTVVSTEKKMCAGHAVLEKTEITFDTPSGPFTFPILYFRPNDGGKHPLLVQICFRNGIYDSYWSPEEIIDRGYALAGFCYTDVTGDNGDFESGIAALYPRDEKTGWGKIGMWAFAASRVIDYLAEKPEIDKDNIGVCGHSRLGKTALWCGAQDERIKFILSNCSGCSGAAYERTKHEGGETIADITGKFPFWFCGNYLKYAGAPEARPFDQHFLIAASAPRYVSVNSASLDNWADQYGEQLSVIAASPVWELLTGTGYNGVKRRAKVGERFLSGNLSYSLRDGVHFFSRNDWNTWMDFIGKHI